MICSWPMARRSVPSSGRPNMRSPHKGFEIDIVPGGFTGIPERTGGVTERLPAIVDDGKWVLDSWLIAEYLDETYPDRPTLIPHPSVKALTQGMEAWLWGTAISPWMTCFIKQYRDRSLDCDHDYVTTSRERMFGRRIEDIIIGREEAPAQGAADAAAHAQTCSPRTDGSAARRPIMRTFALLAVFLFTAAVADTPVLTDDDPLRDWIDRGFDLYGGLGRHPGLSPIFGLQLSEGDPEPFVKGGAIGGLATRNTGVQSTSAETARMKGQTEKA